MMLVRKMVFSLALLAADDASELPKNLSAGKRVIVETKTVDGRVVVSRIAYPEVVISNVPK